MRPDAEDKSKGPGTSYQECNVYAVGQWVSLKALTGERHVLLGSGHITQALEVFCDEDEGLARD